MSTAQVNKLELLEWLASIKDEKVLSELMQWKEDHQRVSIEQYNQELDEANNRISSGEFISHEEVVKESETWLK